MASSIARGMSVALIKPRICRRVYGLPLTRWAHHDGYVRHTENDNFLLSPRQVVCGCLPKPVWANRHSREIHTSSRYEGQIVQFSLSDIGEGIREVSMQEWFVLVGDRVSQFDSLCEVKSDKATVTITSRYDGVIRKLYYDVDDIALVGQPLVDIELDEGATDSMEDGLEDHADIQLTTQSSSGLQAFSDLASTASTGKKSLATPAVRRMAMEYKINLADIQGSGKDGRVLKDDVLLYIDRQSAVIPDSGITSVSQTSTPPPRQKQAPLHTTKTQRSSAFNGKDRTERIKGVTKAMVKTMSIALQIPHFVYSDEIDLTALVTLQPHFKQIVGQKGVKFSYMPIFIKAASMALKEYPILNSSIDEKVENITYKASHNIGFAMDTSEGLIVPNIKDVQNMTVLEVAGELQRLIELGNSGKLGTQDLEGGTFTLSNIGTIGGTYLKPIIFPPQVAIGAVGGIQKLPRFDSQENVKVAHVMQVSFSADHRVIDGATLARFSNIWKLYLQNPAAMILELM